MWASIITYLILFNINWAKKVKRYQFIANPLQYLKYCRKQIAISKILPQALLQYQNIVVQPAHCNIERFSWFKITHDNFPPNNKIPPPFSSETWTELNSYTFSGWHRRCNAESEQ